MTDRRYMLNVEQGSHFCYDEDQVNAKMYMVECDMEGNILPGPPVGHIVSSNQMRGGLALEPFVWEPERVLEFTGKAKILAEKIQRMSLETIEIKRLEANNGKRRFKSRRSSLYRIRRGRRLTVKLRTDVLRGSSERVDSSIIQHGQSNTLSLEKRKQRSGKELEVFFVYGPDKVKNVDRKGPGRSIGRGAGKKPQRRSHSNVMRKRKGCIS